ncbi:MAG: DUF4406 domain-containing protein [Veillonella caviae]|nr:DUF4406 domain-containing protein [Veillonella caviae]
MRKLVYVAHPYGNKEENKVKIDEIMNDLVFNDTGNDYISPIHNFGFAYLDGDEYQKGLDVCLRMLKQCDALVVAKGWEKSRGCIGEIQTAFKNNIPIYTLEDWRKSVCSDGSNIYPDCIVPQK